MSPQQKKERKKTRYDPRKKGHSPIAVGIPATNRPSARPEGARAATYTGRPKLISRGCRDSIGHGATYEKEERTAGRWEISRGEKERESRRRLAFFMRAAAADSLQRHPRRLWPSRDRCGDDDAYIYIYIFRAGGHWRDRDLQWAPRARVYTAFSGAVSFPPLSPFILYLARRREGFPCRRTGFHSDASRVQLGSEGEQVERRNYDAGEWGNSNFSGCFEEGSVCIGRICAPTEELWVRFDFLYLG